MPVTIRKAVTVAKKEAEAKGLLLEGVCIENQDGWRFSFIDKRTKRPLPDDTIPFVDREGRFECEFRGIPPAPIKNAKDVNISKYIVNSGV